MAEQKDTIQVSVISGCESGKRLFSLLPFNVGSVALIPEFKLWVTGFFTRPDFLLAVRPLPFFLKKQSLSSSNAPWVLHCRGVRVPVLLVGKLWYQCQAVSLCAPP